MFKEGYVSLAEKQNELKVEKLKELTEEFDQFRFEVGDAFARLGKNYDELFDLADKEIRYGDKTKWMQLWDSVDWSIRRAFQEFTIEEILEPIAEAYAERQIEEIEKDEEFENESV